MTTRITNDVAFTNALATFEILCNTPGENQEALSKFKSLIIARHSEAIGDDSILMQFSTEDSQEDTAEFRENIDYSEDEYYYSGYRHEPYDFKAGLQNILDGKINLTVPSDFYLGERQNQFHKNRFHPSPEVNDIIEPRREKLQELCSLFGIPFPGEINILQFDRIITVLEESLQVSQPKYVIDRRRTPNKPPPTQFHYYQRQPVPQKNTFKAMYSKTLLKKNKQDLPLQLQTHQAYADAIVLVGKLRGRMHNIFYPSMQAICLVMDKTGLMQFYPETSDLLTNILVSHIMASFSVQKLFTIDAQMHGGLDQWLSAYLELLIAENRPTTDYLPIFLLVPSNKTVELVDPTTLQKIYNDCLAWLNLISKLFEEQWVLGVNDCATKLMKVPRSGTTKIHVNAWNACAGAWGNLLRFIKIIGRRLSIPPLELTKVLKLTAGDQMSWAESDGKGVDPDAAVFLALTSDGIMPWSGLTSSVPDFLERVTHACEEHSVDVRKWVNGPVERKAETRGDISSVCGVVVPELLGSALKEMGAFGAHPYGNKA